MGRRKTKPEDAPISIQLFVICLLISIFPATVTFFGEKDRIWGIIGLLVIWSGCIGLLVAMHKERESNLYHAKGKIERAVRDHLEELARRHFSLSRVDHYGIQVNAPWEKEWDHFWRNVALAGLTSIERKYLEDDIARPNSLFIEDLQNSIRTRSRQLQNTLNFNSEMSPTEFEIWCKESLIKCGWSARTTQGSGDQGADVIAEKNDLRLVVQCKLYSKAVGNKAVQEVSAARQHYRTDKAVVLSKSGYTKSAKELAKTTDILLLDVSDISRIDEIINK